MYANDDSVSLGRSVINIAKGIACLGAIVLGLIFLAVHRE